MQVDNKNDYNTLDIALFPVRELWMLMGKEKMLTKNLHCYLLFWMKMKVGIWMTISKSSPTQRRFQNPMMVSKKVTKCMELMDISTAMGLTRGTIFE